MFVIVYMDKYSCYNASANRNYLALQTALKLNRECPCLSFSPPRSFICFAIVELVRENNARK